jgi:hypothetical protein
MIQVQIASTLDAGGVTGVRWVLIDPTEVAAAAPPSRERRAEPPPPAAPVPGAKVKRTTLALHAVSAAVLLCALTLAWWTASRMVEARSSHTSKNASAIQAPAHPS